MKKTMFSRGVAPGFALAVLLCAPLALLSACGGGGGGGDSGGNPPPTSTAVVITTANAQPVAAEALEASSSTDAAGSAGFVTGVQLASGAGPKPMRLASAARLLLARVPDAPALATGVTQTQTVSCSGGGSLTMTVTSSGGSGVVAGDSVRMAASNCAEGTGTSAVVMNGVMTISILSGSYDSASTAYPKSITMRIVAENFTVIGGGDNELLNGDMTIALTQNSATSAAVSVTSSSLTSKVGTATASHTVILTNYSAQVTETSAGSSITTSATVSTTNSRIGTGTVTYTIATPTPITVSSTGALTGGVLKVTGSGSALLLTVTAPDTMTLQVDTNGDGSYESSSTVTRSQLQAQL